MRRPLLAALVGSAFWALACSGIDDPDGPGTEPEPIETLVKTSPLIEQAVVVGQDQKALGVLIVPSPEALEREVPEAEWGRAGDLLTADPLKRLYRGELDRLEARGHRAAVLR